MTRQPLVIEELQSDPRFAREAAESTGYVPKGLMAVPLLHEERALGVLEVLDRPQRAAFSLAEMELLGLFANQAAIALDLLQRRTWREPCSRTRAARVRRWRGSAAKLSDARARAPRGGAASARGDRELLPPATGFEDAGL